MNQKTLDVYPPRLIPSIVAGFNSVASHIYLILFPVILDLFLWFGPHLRIRELFEPASKEFYRQMIYSGAIDLNTAKGAQEMVGIVLERFNLFSLLRSLPIGIPSLMAGQVPIRTPLGAAPTYEVNSLASVLGLWLILSLTGIFLGCLYFNEIVRVCSENHLPFWPARMKQVAWKSVQVLLLTIALFFVIFLLLVPASLIISLMVLINGSLAQVGLFFLFLFLLWMLVPLSFSSHGIFAFSQNMIVSTLTSMRLVRSFLPGTGLFLLVAILIYQGLNVIWTVPPETSWMLLVGVLGHGFISTALLTSSFIYYLGGIRWMQYNLDQLARQATRPA